MNTVLEQFTKGTVFFIQRIDSIKFGLCKWNCIGTGFHIRQFFPRCRQSTIPAINDGNEILSRFYLFTVDVSSFVMDFKLRSRYITRSTCSPSAVLRLLPFIYVHRFFNLQERSDSTVSSTTMAISTVFANLRKLDGGRPSIGFEAIPQY